MTYRPVLIGDGYLGWQFLQRTKEPQKAAHAATEAARRDEAYFRAHIAGVNSAEDLVRDRTLLRVTLTAFGLQDDLQNRAYLQKVFESSIYDPKSFVNRLTDKRYYQMAQAFGFADRVVPRNQFQGFADDILGKFRDRSFEVAVGEQSGDMRLSLALQRDLPELAAKAIGDSARWFTLLGTPSLREVFERAFNLPTAFGQLDLDRQVDILRRKTESLTGAATVEQFTRPEALDALTRRFLLMGQISQIQGVSGQSAALSLLQAGQASLSGMLRR